jgi:hypothetical protein
MALEQEESSRLVTELVRECIGEGSDREVRVRALGDELSVSHDTIRRWALGKNRPMRHAGTSIVRYLRIRLKSTPTPKEWQDTVKSFLDKGDEKTRLLRVRVIARTFGTSLPTVERWASGENHPHPAMMKGAYADLDRIIREQT